MLWIRRVLMTTSGKSEKLEVELQEINAKLDTILELLTDHRGGRGGKKDIARRYDPLFIKDLRDHMHERNMSQSDLAAMIWGRDAHGKAIKRDRISVWLAGKSYPSKRNYQKILDVFNLV
jgi:hypothetical protein